MIFPLTITNPTLHTVDLNPVVPYDGSLFCVDARDFQTAAWTGQWIDKVSDTPFAVGVGTPTVVDNGGVRMVRTGGTARLERMLAVSNPHTVIFKGTAFALSNNLSLVAGYGSSQPIVGHASTTNYSMFGGTQLVASPVIAPVASANVIVIASFNGASSALWVNGVKTAGNAGTSSVRAGIRLGSNASASSGYNVGCAHLEIVDGACSDAFAAQIMADLIS